MTLAWIQTIIETGTHVKTSVGRPDVFYAGQARIAISAMLCRFRFVAPPVTWIDMPKTTACT